MTATAGASSASFLTWDTINWTHVKENVSRLQIRIAKATREGKHGKVKALQWILTHAFHAKLLAVKRVVLNPGSKTPGVDNVLWKTANQKMRAALSLKRQGYQPKPLKRIYIPKRNGQQRPLSIPTMKCRAMQALHLLALEPVVEMKADKNAYGFRPKRSTADAIEQCFKILRRKTSAQWVLEGDIKSCFDQISHPWLMDNISMDKEILRKWLKAGYMEKGHLYPTSKGTPQGGIISPVLLNATLSGLERVIKSATKPGDKVHIVIYADDFIITGESQETLENKIKPLVKMFLAERGLELSQEKTKVTRVIDGFNFLGFNIRKYKGKAITKPSQESVKSFLKGLREIVRKSRSIKTEALIQLLNLKIRGWTNYFCHGVSKKTFRKIDCALFKMLWRWSKRRHPHKSKAWIKEKYFRSSRTRNWIFYGKTVKEDGTISYLDLFEAHKVPIRRHIKIRAEATPYDSAFEEYFKQRETLRTRKPG
jgi:RNA-directed DNA polymerase